LAGLLVLFDKYVNIHAAKTQENPKNNPVFISFLVFFPQNELNSLLQETWGDLRLKMFFSRRRGISSECSLSEHEAPPLGPSVSDEDCVQ
jgi:hypothetical protein